MPRICTASWKYLYFHLKTAAISISSASLCVMSGSSWCLDPSKLPQRLDFEVSDDAYECLQRLSAKAGISVRDLAERLISQSISPLQLHS